LNSPRPGRQRRLGIPLMTGDFLMKSITSAQNEWTYAKNGSHTLVDIERKPA
jgi:hypothetical protein